MKIAKAILQSVIPYSQSKHYVVDKLNDGKESHQAYEERTWKNRCHVNKDGYVFIPPMSFKNCIAEAAKFLSISIPGAGKATYTKHFEAGVLVMEGLTLDLHIDDVEGEWLFVPSDGKRGGGSRVNKCFPIIHEWSGEVNFMVLDEKITEKVFRKVLEESGKFIGLGRFRPRNNGFYGRFSIASFAWIDA